MKNEKKSGGGRDGSEPVDDPDQLVIEELPEDQANYLGNINVTGELFNQFARTVVTTYDEFLRGEKTGEIAQQEIAALIRRYADIFMGRSDEYIAAPWQRSYKLGGRLRAMYQIKGDIDAGEGYFAFLAAQCFEAAKAMADGMNEYEAGARLKEIIDDGIGRFMYIIR